MTNPWNVTTTCSATSPLVYASTNMRGAASYTVTLRSVLRERRKPRLHEYLIAFLVLAYTGRWR